MPSNDPQYSRIYNRAWHKRNGVRRRKQIKDRKKEIRNWFVSYRMTLQCDRCPEDHPATLDFHHRDGDSKITEVTRMVNNGWGLTRIKEEIRKCVILCSNCHRKEHHNARSSNRSDVGL